MDWIIVIICVASLALNLLLLFISHSLEQNVIGLHQWNQRLNETLEDVQIRVSAIDQRSENEEREKQRLKRLYDGQ
ncbi:hypothetical protein [Aquidulcibacter sp.]|jgi:hypothetical protein|uniref:hypothetical protein n=1 Tax=Aquidulcibacter sp. TaxID=2052990 RepID=UPI003784C52F